MLSQPNEKKSKPNFYDYLVKGVDRVLKETKVPPWISVLLIVIHFLQLIFIMFEVEILIDATGMQSFFYYANFLVVHNILESFTLVVGLSSLISSAFVAGLLYYGFFIACTHKKPSPSLLRLLGLLTYSFEHVLFLPLAGLLLSAFFLPSDLSPAPRIAILVSAAFILACLLVAYFLSSLLFFNFSLRSKDGFARGPELEHCAFRLIALLLLVLDCSTKSSGFAAKVILGLVLSLLLALDFARRLPYHCHSATLAHMFGIFLLFWVSILIFFGGVLVIQLIKDNLVVTIAAGLILFLWDLCSYRDLLLNRLLAQDFSAVTNSHMLEKKVRLFLKLVKGARKSTVDELRLASVVTLHVEGCRTTDCVCHNRATAWDARKRAGADLSVPPFKDAAFLKNLLFAFMREAPTRTTAAPELQFTYVLLLSEELGNFGLADQETSSFIARFGRPAQAPHRFALARLQKQARILLKRSNRASPVSVNRFERLLEYDRGLCSLKLA